MKSLTPTTKIQISVLPTKIITYASNWGKAEKAKDIKYLGLNMNESVKS
jgi:hypothetical protein